MNNLAIYINKDFSRILVENEHCDVLSGTLTIPTTRSFKPIVVKYSVFNRVKAYLKDLKLIKVNLSDVDISIPKGVYQWVRLPDGLVVRVWGANTNFAVSKIVDDRIMVKGIGMFKPEDVKQFNFR